MKNACLHVQSAFRAVGGRRVNAGVAAVRFLQSDRKSNELLRLLHDF